MSFELKYTNTNNYTPYTHRLTCTDIVKLNRSLRRAFDVNTLNHMSNTLIDNIITDVIVFTLSASLFISFYRILFLFYLYAHSHTRTHTHIHTQTHTQPLEYTNKIYLHNIYFFMCVSDVLSVCIFVFVHFARYAPSIFIALSRSFLVNFQMFPT